MVPKYYRRNVWLVLLALVCCASPVLGQVPALDMPLTTEAGDPGRGKAVAVNSDLGNCLICHGIPISEVPPGSSGDIGPSLEGIGARLSAGQLRQRIVDPKVINPQTIMPAYFISTGLTRVGAAYAGKTILSAQQIEDLVAFLQTLK